MFAWLKHLAGFGRPASPRERQLAQSEQMREEIRDSLETGLREGFDGDETIIQRTVDLLQDDLSEAEARAMVEELFPAVLQAYEEEVRTWPAETDCDRLDRAFAQLEESGILARQNFSCCGTCGAGEAVEEMREAHEEGRLVRGYTFYHQQDTESAASGGGIYLGYGAWLGGEEEHLAIGHEVVAALKQSGLQTVWNGSLNTRIGVELDWKRRRT